MVGGGGVAGWVGRGWCSACALVEKSPSTFRSRGLANHVMAGAQRALATGNVTSSALITRLHGQAAPRGPAQCELPSMEVQTPERDRSTRIFEKSRRVLRAAV